MYAYLERFGDNKALIYTVLAGMVAGFAVMAIPYRNFWLAFFGFFAVAVVLCNYKAGLYLMVPLIMVEPQKFVFTTSHSMPSDFVGIFYPVAILAFVSWTLRKLSKIPGGLERETPNVEYFILFIISWSALTLLWAPGAEHGLLNWIRLLGNAIVFYLMVNAVKDEGTHRTIINIIFISAFVIAIASFLSVTIYHYRNYEFTWKVADFVTFNLNWFVFEQIYNPRAQGFVAHNTVAAIMNFTMALVFARLMTVKKLMPKVILFAFLIMMGVAHLYTKSRGALVGGFIMWMFLIAAIPWVRKRYVKNLALFFLVFLSVFVTVNHEDVFGEGSRFSASTSEYSIHKRISWWIKGYGFLEEKSGLVGLGAGGLKYYFDPLGIPHAHNVYLSFLFDFGVIGFVAVAVFIGYLFAKFYPVLVNSEKTYIQTMLWGSIGGLVAMGTHGLIDGEYNMSMLWFFLGLAVAALKLSKIEIRNRVRAESTA
ncbi:MAG: O-antigen ligase family protein [Deltaproteobacteria bacterium]|nr:O-antigen ligase family protein [Deltaproteobacteria bacterium]